jgi:hypothetical protein
VTPLEPAREAAETPAEPIAHPEYVLATDLPGSAVEDESFYHRRAAHRIAEAVEQVLKIEAPLHLSELTRRVAAGWGVSRVTAKPQRRVAQLLEGLDPPPIVRDDFVWRGDQNPDSWRTVRVPGHVRDAEAIPPEEVAAAVELALRGSVSTGREALARGAASVLGIRAGARVRAVMDAGIDLLVARGTCAVEGDVVTLR